MPLQSGKSLLAKYGQKVDGYVKSHAGDDVKLGNFAELPPGITNGVAQLVEAKFDIVKPGKTNAGEVFLLMTGIMLQPDVTEDGSPVKGLRTSKIEMCCDTTVQTGKNAGKVVSQEEHIANVLNYFKLFGVSKETLAEGVSILEPVAAQLKQMKPYFKLTTTPRKDDKGVVTGVWENWLGTAGLEGWTPPAAGSGVDEGTPETQPGGNAQPPDATNEASPAADGGEDLDNLASLADSNPPDAGAQNQLMELGASLGTTQEEFDACQSWVAFVEVIRQKQAEASTPQESAAPAPKAAAAAKPSANGVPKKGSMYGFKVLDSKTKKPMIDLKTKKERAPVECEVQSVDATKRIVSLLNYTDKKTVYKDVPWAQLITQ
jgi:hypothetical protein